MDSTPPSSQMQIFLTNHVPSIQRRSRDWSFPGEIIFLTFIPFQVTSECFTTCITIIILSIMYFEHKWHEKKSTGKWVTADLFSPPPSVFWNYSHFQQELKVVFIFPASRGDASLCFSIHLKIVHLGLLINKIRIANYAKLSKTSQSEGT